MKDVTEKIVNAHLAGAIPIYYGTLDALKIFNSRALIWWDPTEPELALGTLILFLSSQVPLSLSQFRHVSPSPTS